MKLKAALLCLTALALLAPSLVSARSGCCSSHGGVCGCGCCDGSSLSRTCAPYYPQCNKVQEEVPAQVQQLFVPVVNTPAPLPTRVIYPTSSPTPSPKPTTVRLQRPTTKPSRKISPTIRVTLPDAASKIESGSGIWTWLRSVFK